jgi:hypothetical protein
MLRSVLARPRHSEVESKSETPTCLLPNSALYDTHSPCDRVDTVANRRKSTKMLGVKWLQKY